LPRGEGRRRSPPTWGYWTEQKLSMLAAYLTAFTTASSRASRTLHLDLFAGEHRNLSRTTGEEISGSPRVALDTAPPFTKVVLFELPAQAARLDAELRMAYPQRDFEVIPGNCNQQLGPVLDRLSRDGWNWAPTFTLLDQLAAEIHWSTLDQLSRFKRAGRPKAELWLLFASSMLPRGLASVDPAAVDRFADRITAMYGTEDWRDAYLARGRGLLTGAELRDELLNLMRWRLEKVLGYRVTHSFGMKNTRGMPLYNMVFATDHQAGERIMNHIYGKAAEVRPQMQAEAAARLQAEKEEKSGKLGLFPPLPKAVKPEELYTHQPPVPPFQLSPDQ
jgi:three-Cys-motif partner protein